MMWFWMVLIGVPMTRFVGQFWAGQLRHAVSRAVQFAQRCQADRPIDAYGQRRPRRAVNPTQPGGPADVRYEAAVKAALRIVEYGNFAVGEADAPLLGKITYLLLESFYDTERQLAGARPTGGSSRGHGDIVVSTNN